MMLPNAMVGLYRIERQIGWWPLLSRGLTIRVYAAQETIREQQAAIGWSGLTPGTNFVLLAATIGTHPQPFRPVESCSLQN
jgi:hypothetical protein